MMYHAVKVLTHINPRIQKTVTSRKHCPINSISKLNLSITLRKKATFTTLQKSIIEFRRFKFARIVIPNDGSFANSYDLTDVYSLTSKLVL